MNALDGLLLSLIWVSYIAACHISVFSTISWKRNPVCLYLLNNWT